LGIIAPSVPLRVCLFRRVGRIIPDPLRSAGGMIVCTYPCFYRCAGCHSSPVQPPFTRQDHPLAGWRTGFNTRHTADRITIHCHRRQLLIWRIYPEPRFRQLLQNNSLWTTQNPLWSGQQLDSRCVRSICI